MTQGNHGADRRWAAAFALVLALGGPAASAAVCAGPGPQLQRLALGVWWWPGAPGDSDPDNRGAVSNLLAVRAGARLWLVGAGPSPRVAATLACRLRAAGAGRVTDVIVPWPRAELALGVTAFAGARRWAHAEVAAVMRQRCPRCVERMHARLGPAAADLGDDPVRVPEHTVQGAHGRLGPFEWWLAGRGEGTPLLLLRHRGLWTGHGLLWSDGPPDLRDADAGVLDGALQAWRTRLPASARVLPEQGPWQGPEWLDRSRAYLAALDERLRQAQQRLEDETAVPAGLTGVDAAWTAHPRHGLNWQRRWQQLERLPAAAR